MLDTNRLFFNDAIKITVIDPFPEKFKSIVRKSRQHFSLVGKKVQDVNDAVFSELGAGDILFIDSTHVSKIGSDVNHLLFNVLPKLSPGVWIHLHDIIYPFEYPRQWFYEGKAWNEAYLLRAFLQFNQPFKIMFFSTYLEHFYEEKFREKMPLCLKNRGGSIWLRKV